MVNEYDRRLENDSNSIINGHPSKRRRVQNRYRSTTTFVSYSYDTLNHSDSTENGSPSNKKCRPRKQVAIANIPSRSEDYIPIPARLPVSRLPFLEELVDGPNVIGHRHRLNTDLVACRHCGALNLIDEKVQSPKGIIDFSLCCGRGSVCVPDVTININQDLVDLVSNDKDFVSNIRAYNSAMSFTSMGCNLDTSLANMSDGVYTFRISGSIYHRMGSLLPGNPEDSAFAQIYIMDDKDQSVQRNKAFNNALDISTLIRLENVLQGNPFSQMYRNIREREEVRNELLRPARSGTELVSAGLRIVIRAKRNQHQFSLPSVSEIALLTPESMDSTQPRDIIVEGRDGELKRISETHISYDPLHYVLLHPGGDHGWTFHSYPLQMPNGDSDQLDNSTGQITSINAENSQSQQGYVTARQFYAYRIQIRPISTTDKRCYFWMCGRLMHQYVVDQYVKIETNRLNFVRQNQDLIRADKYKGVLDAVANDVSACNVGHQVILPSSFNGSPRDMQQRFQDAMAIVRRFGKPDLFITFTCNPKWPEISAMLHPGQDASDRPDVCVRVFRLKLKAFLDDLLKKDVLGVVIAYTWVIEFQKRGLPHCHILLILDNDSKIRTPDDIDTIVSAEIPDPVVAPLARQTILDVMIHGPCGLNKGQFQKCFVDGRCSKGFPRSFCNDTIINDDGYPQYRRRNTGPVVIQQGNRSIRVDNRWVVPHNLWLTTKYNAHINVEICMSVASVKYLYKYIYKGHDRAEVGLQNETSGNQERAGQATDQPRVIDEIDDYITCRYISACESLWRIFQFPLHGHSPNIVRLPVHLEDEQAVTFDIRLNLQDIVHANQNSMLMAWFTLNTVDIEARELSYIDIPEHYSWDKSTRSWKRRVKNTKTIGRMYSVHPTERERYCLRLLLLNVKGAQSFQDLRTFDSTVYPTYAEAALARGLMQDDNEWRMCLQEAVMIRFPGRLRLLFATILHHCNPVGPGKLWEEFASALSEDHYQKLKRELQESARLLAQDIHGDYHDDHLLIEVQDHAQNLALVDINRLLNEMGSDLSNHHGMPLIPEGLSDTQDRLFEVQLLETLRAEADKNVPLLNELQKMAFDRITEAIVGNIDGRLFFIDGPGGTGKTFLYNTLIAHVRGKLRLKAIVTASSGIAAMILHGGRTAHSAFKIPIVLDKDTPGTVTKQSRLAEEIREAALIIWDEAPMQHKFAFGYVDRLLRDLMDKKDVPFGGKVVVFGGDFRQTLPVVVRGSQSQIEDACLCRSTDIWRHVEILHLRVNMRLGQCPQADAFAAYLLRIGDGSEATLTQDYVRIPDELIFTPDHSAPDSAVKQLIRHVYPDIGSRQCTPEYFNGRAILTTLNINVDELNTLATEMFYSGDAKIYTSIDSIPDAEANARAAASYPPEYLNSLNPTELPPHTLVLKVGQPIMLIRNLNNKKGLCNGTRLIVRALKNKYILAEVMFGQSKGQLINIPRVPLFNNNDTSMPVQFKRLQFPVKPAFALTINKSQGQTLKHVGIYLPQPVFTHGQLYVALSRCSNPSNIKIYIQNGRIKGCQGFYTRNPVFRGVLMDIHH